MYILPQSLQLGGSKQKYEANLAALRLLKKMEEQRIKPEDLTDVDRSTLAHYVGWGDTNVRKMACDWRGKAIGELADLVGDGELEALNKSVLNAHYTELGIVRAIWGGLEQLGVGNLEAPWILEPAAGVGHFIGAAPVAIRTKATFAGVELDTLTARICSALYPEVTIHQCGFEVAPLPMGRFDVVVSNVPFGDYGVIDPTLKPKMLTNRIHDYFLCRGLTMLRPGGIMAVITSRYTLDKEQSHVREWMAERAELLAAYRLPHTAFEENAGTSVVTDVLFFRRLGAGEIPANVEWIKTHVVSKEIVNHYGSGDHAYTTVTPWDYRINNYFRTRPLQILGEVIPSKHGLYGGKEPTVSPHEGMEDAAALRAAIRSTLPAGIIAPSEEVDDDGEERPAAKVERPLIFSSGTPIQKSLEGIYQAAKMVLQGQVDGIEDEEVAAAQAELNRLYDAFRAAHGPMTIRLGKRSKAKPPVEEVKGTAMYPFLLALEDQHGQKQAIFQSRTVRPMEKVIQVDSARDALYICLDKLGKVNLKWIAHAVGRSILAVRNELRGLIFRTPEGHWETADEYLSGNVRVKLRQATALAAMDINYEENVKALTDAIPPPLGPEDIFARMGAGWIPEGVVLAFIEHIFPEAGRSHYHGKTRVKYVDTTAEWYLENFSPDVIRSVENITTWGTRRRTGIDLIVDALNSKTPIIYDTAFYTDGDGRRRERQVKNEEESMLAQAKLADIKAKWNSWIWSNQDRATLLCRIYNETYNGFRVCQFDGSHLTFPGMTNTITLRAHQLSGVARTLRASTDNPAYIHEVGAGKTFTGVCAAVKGLQLGLMNKAMFVVPKHLVGQWRDAFALLYPGMMDQVLVADAESFTPINRAKTIARIATGDCLISIITYEQFKAISLSLKDFENALNQEIGELREHLIDLKDSNSDNKEANRRLEREFKKREAGLERFRIKFREKDGEIRRDDREIITFEQLGVDTIFFDESQALKNDWVATKMNNVAGMPKAESQRAFDARVKIHRTLAHGGRVVFLTGTPITNTLAECFVVMRFLQPTLLRSLGLQHFDGWAGVFAETFSSVEMDAVGKFRTQTRLRFTNLPEMMALLGQSWDRAKVLVEKPALVGGQMKVVKVDGSAALRAGTLELARRAERIRSRQVKPDEDNMLLVTSDGRQMALFNGPASSRFVAGTRTKVDALVEKVLEIHKEYQGDRATQLVFCDLFTPKARGELVKETEVGAEEDEGAEVVSAAESFIQEGVYGEIRRRLVQGGVPDAEIAYIHEAKTEKGKDVLFRKVREGTVRVLIGSTSKMGTGMNVQDRCVALHHLDCPWRPADLEQRNGRILRQGNMYKEVYVYAYVTEGSYDPVNWQYIETKSRFIAQVMAGEVATRTAEDVGDMIMTASMIKAIALGDARILDKIKVECELLSLSKQYKAWVSDQVRMKWRMDAAPVLITEAEKRIEAVKQAIETRRRYEDQDFTITLWVPQQERMVTFRKREDANKHLVSLAEIVHKARKKGKKAFLPKGTAGSYRGFMLELEDWSGDMVVTAVHRSGSRVPTRVTEKDPLHAIDYHLKNMETRIGQDQTIITQTKKELESLKVELTRAWPHVGRARDMMNSYHSLCAELAQNGLIDRQEFDFGVLESPTSPLVA